MLKKVYKVGLVTLMILVVIFYLSHVLLQKDYDSRLNDHIGCFTTELLGVPFQDKKSKNIIIENTDLEEITYNEWMEMKCECPGTKTNEYDPWVPQATLEEKNSLGIVGQKHIMCLLPDILLHGQDAKNLSQECMDREKCDAFLIVINEYVIRYPKVLNNLIKIVEKPCSYLKESPTLEEINNTPDKANYDILNDMHFWNNQLREKLFCDSNIKKRTIIRIIDSKNKPKYDIVVPRIDIPEVAKK